VRDDARAGARPILGWPTDPATKPILVDDLARAIAEGSVIMHSPDLVDECMSFVTKDSGAQEAQQGAHDDRAMALGIAWQVRQRAVARGTTERPQGWSPGAAVRSVLDAHGPVAHAGAMKPEAARG
jgi:hypothetical protein